MLELIEKWPKKDLCFCVPVAVDKLGSSIPIEVASTPTAGRHAIQSDVYNEPTEASGKVILNKF